DGRRVATQLARQLAEPAPYDRSDVDLAHYRRLAPRWRQWTAIVSACQTLAMGILDAVLAGE
ncbi:MAG TPA: hypothetical protein VNE21_07025, partial [Mycobacteriales bacterium]|nr:hypothetical protein [Mycobacteriales bacterium]